MPSVKIQVSGKVQGVWFRKYTCDEAIEIGLLGTVQNLQNGDVLIYVSGTKQQISALVKWCWQGSPLSNVSDVKLSTTESVEFPDFRIIE
ncbi:MAG: acylphosphatase [Flavobacteriales bacterium]|nr:acylphosphatase [Flavobacteriales bacterium]